MTRQLSPLAHVFFTIWVVGMLGLARMQPGLYEVLVQEDRLVEWWSVFLFLFAGVSFGVTAWTTRRLGDAGVAVFCLVAAGEEVSWGQRILGFMPSTTFLESNAQQEANLHNLVEAFGQPKWTLIAVLVAYGIATPILARMNLGHRLAERFGLTIPVPGLALWFAVAVTVLVWYPVRLTGEWVETLAGALFLTASPVKHRMLGLLSVISLAMAVIAERASALASSDPDRIACAQAEVIALVADVTADSLAPAMTATGRTHRRLFSLWQDGDLDRQGARNFAAVRCAPQRDLATRRRYGVDPWGTAYWVRAETDDRGRRLHVYSFGPNRRRDSIEGTGMSGDDIGASNIGR